jgi:hypothetical protein
MAGSTYYPAAAVSYSFDNSPCWTEVQPLPVGDTWKKCTKPNPPCEHCAGSVRVLSTGDVTHYEFDCDPNPATAGYIRHNAATGQVEVVNWSKET